MKNNARKRYFTFTEVMLLIISYILIIGSHIMYGNDFINMISPIIGVTAILLAAKANPLGPLLMIVFSVLYGIISFSFKYYGEMITYIGMALPMNVMSFVAWVRHPYNGNKAEVVVSHVTKRDAIIMSILTIFVTVVFYFILGAFHTANLLPSTFSIATSFVAAFLQYKRSPYYSVAYASNDLVLMVLWVLATICDITYVPVAICFVVFFFNDLYGFINWIRIRKRQQET